MGSYQRSKFFKRFLAAIAALFFWSSNLIFPAAVQAQMNTQVPLPSAATAAVLSQLSQVAGSTAVVTVAKEAVKATPFKPVPLIVGGLVAGAAYYLITEAMKESFKEKAMQNYCKANPSSPLCGSGAEFYRVTAKGISEYYCNKLDYLDLFAEFVDLPTIVLKPIPKGSCTGAYIEGGGTFLNGNWFQYGGYAFPETVRIEHVGGKKPWEQWPPADKDAALETLTPEDIEPVIDIPPLFLTPNKTFSDGGWYIAPSGAFEFSPPSFVVPPDSPAPEFSPPPSFPPSSEQNDDLDDDGERNEIDFDIDNDGDWNLTDNNDFDFNVNTENPPKSEPTPTPTPKPSSTPGCKCCPDPVTGELPSLAHECEVEFTDENFLAHLVNVAANKFPFDIIGAIPSVDPPYPCPTFTFWGQAHEFCIINDILKAFKWVAWIAFSIKAVLSL